MPVAKKRPPKNARNRPTNRRLLIKGFSGNLPVDLLDEPVFRVALRQYIQGYAGIYVLYQRDRIYYIGLATNLYSRLRSHKKLKGGEWDSFRIFRINRHRLLKDVESLILRIVRPPGSRVSGNFLKGGDFTKALRRVQRIQHRRYTKIGKLLRAST
jgi:hypothetical protein